MNALGKLKDPGLVSETRGKSRDEIWQ